MGAPDTWMQARASHEAQRDARSRIREAVPDFARAGTRAYIHHPSSIFHLPSSQLIILSPNRCIYIYWAMSESQLPTLPCLCGNLRRASRALTQLYEEALRPSGLRATQFTVLQALSLAGEVSQGRLGEILAIDSTTLTRTLAVMSREGWITDRRGADRRERRLRLSRAGESQLRRALPFWERVQARMRGQLGEPTWNALFLLSHQITSTATQGD